MGRTTQNQLIVMVSISDSQGAITNVTLTTVVAPQSSVSSNQTAYLATIQAFITSNNVSLSTAQEVSL